MQQYIIHFQPKQQNAHPQSIFRPTGDRLPIHATWNTVIPWVMEHKGETLWSSRQEASEVSVHLVISWFLIITKQPSFFHSNTLYNLSHPFFSNPLAALIVLSPARLSLFTFFLLWSTANVTTFIFKHLRRRLWTYDGQLRIKLCFFNPVCTQVHQPCPVSPNISLTSHFRHNTQ